MQTQQQEQPAVKPPAIRETKGSVPASFVDTLAPHVRERIRRTTPDGKKIVHHAVPKSPFGSRKAYAWEGKHLTPVDVHPRTGRVVKARRFGKHACQKGGFSRVHQTLVGR